MTTLYLCGAGNPEGVRLALRVAEASSRWDRLVVLDDDPGKHGGALMDVAVIGGFERLADHRAGDEAVNLVARTTSGRDRARARIEAFGIPLTSLIDPSIDTRGVTLGRGVTVYAGATLSALGVVADHAVVFTQAVLGHGARLGEGAVLAPGAVVNARVQVGARAYVGANATVLPDLEVGVGATVSACSAAVGDVPPGETVIGVPAQALGGAESAGGAASERTAVPLSAVCACFAEVIGCSSVGSDDNFFDAGGSSKAALVLQRRLEVRLAMPVGLLDLFRFPTPARLAAHLGGGQVLSGAEPSRAEIRRRRRFTPSRVS